MTRPLPPPLQQWMQAQPRVGFAPGEMLVRPDETPTSMWWIESGLACRFSLESTGQRYIQEFLAVGDWAFGRLAWRDGAVCCGARVLGVQALAVTQAIAVPISLLAQWRERDAEVGDFVLASLFGVAQAGVYLQADLMHRTAEERYVELIRMAPDIARSVPQVEIAAWLGITPVALSRIRRRLGQTPRAHDMPERQEAGDRLRRL